MTVEAYKNAGYSQEQRPVIFGIDGLEDALEAVKKEQCREQYTTIM